MELSTIPRTVFKTYLQGLRLPLRGLEAVTRHRGDETWPPTLAFEGFEASAKLVVGSVLRDRQLADEGRIQQAKLSELRRASDLEVKAEHTRAAAGVEEKARLERADERRDRAAQQAEQGKRAAEARRRRAQQNAQRQQEQRAQAVAKADEAREKRLARTERTGRLRTVHAESAALTREKRAVAAADKVLSLDKAIEQRKAKRKSS